LLLKQPQASGYDGDFKTSSDVPTDYYTDQQNQSLWPAHPLCHTLKNGVKIHVIKGEITEQRVDAIVIEVDKQLQCNDLNLVGERILLRGGPQAIPECADTMNDPEEDLSEGNVVYTSGGNLPCRYVIYMVSPDWKQKEHYITLLRRSYLESLCVASRLKLCSIAFPDVFFWSHLTNTARCTEAMLNAVEDFCHLSSSDEAKNTTLREVRIVLHFPKTMRMFRKEFAKRYSFQETPTFTPDEEKTELTASIGFGEGLSDEQQNHAFKPPTEPQTKIPVSNQISEGRI